MSSKKLISVINLILIIIFLKSPCICKEITGSLPCKIIDKRTKIAINRARVCINEIDSCIISDSSGNAVLKAIKPQFYSITTSAYGYDTLLIPNIPIKSGINNLLTIILEKTGKIKELDKILIKAHKVTTKKSHQTTSVTRLNNYELSNIAGTANDINRVLETQPSVMSKGGDFDNTLYVRGGHSRENVYIIDGIEIDNISHFSDVANSGGGMGYINGALVDHLDFYAGGISCSYPPRISSVIDINLRNGSLLDQKYQIDLNMSGLGLLLEGPFPQNRGSYILGLRFMDLHALKSFLNQEGVPQFGDSQSKLSFFLNENNTLNLTNIFGFDIYKENNISRGSYSTDWTQKLIQFASGISWKAVHPHFQHSLQVSFTMRNDKHIEEINNFNGPITLNEGSIKYNWLSLDDTVITIDDTLYFQKDEITKKDLFCTDDKRKYISLKEDITFNLRENDQMQLGVSGRRGIYKLRECNGKQNISGVYWYTNPSDTTEKDSIILRIYKDFDLDSTFISDHIGGYIQYIFNQNIIKTLAGLRIDYFRLLRDYGISPRIGLSVTALPIGIFSLSGGLYYQLPADLSGKISDLVVPNPNYLYPLPKLSELELQRNWQIVLSYEHEFPKLHFLTLEAYYKWYDREYTLYNPVIYSYKKEFEDALNGNYAFSFPKPRGKKKAYGIELMLQKRQQKGLFYTLAYSLSLVKNRYANGKWYDDKNCVRNSLGLTLGTTLFKSHTLSFRLAAGEGLPYSKLIQYSKFDTATGFNTERLKPKYSVNLKYSFRFFRHWGNITGYVEIWNILHYRPIVERNIEYYGYRDFLNRYFEYYNYLDIKANGIIPVAGITVDF